MNGHSSGSFSPSDALPQSLNASLTSEGAPRTQTGSGDRTGKPWPLNPNAAMDLRQSRAPFTLMRRVFFALQPRGPLWC